MSLIDALLLEPAPFEVWIAFRSGQQGSGTLNDPFDGSTTARFDAIMNSLASLASPNTLVHLGPGVFTTAGYKDATTSAGWQIQPGMKIAGSGIGATTLRLVDVSGTDMRFYAIGHDLSATSPRDLCEVADLTIDCNLPTGTHTIACGAVRLMGNHVRIRNVRAISWGTKSSSKTCFVFAAISGNWGSGSTTPTEPIDVGIEGCIAELPAANNTGNVSVFHVGGSTDAASVQEAFGKVPFIRNCYVDCGNLSDPFGQEIRALSMNWCKGGVVEGNQIQNVKIGGPYIENSSSREMIIRSNSYKNVKRGPWLKFGSVYSSSLSLSGITLPLSSPSTVAEANSAGHPFQPGDHVRISGASYDYYNGVFTVTEVTGTDTFRYVMAGRPAGNSGSATAEKLFGGSNLLIEKNVIELAVGSNGEIAIHVSDGKAEDPTPSTSLDTPDYDCLEAIIRENRVRYFNSQFETNYAGTGIKVSGVKNVIVQNNVLEVAPSNPLKDFRCGTVKYFNNKTPAGALIQGVNGLATTKYSELETEAEDALVLTLM